METKDLIASVINARARQVRSDDAAWFVAAVVADLAMRFINTSDRFHAERFVTACTADAPLVADMIERVPATFGTHYYPSVHAILQGRVRVGSNLPAYHE